MIDRNIDILHIAETKLDESVPNNQFVYQYNQSIYTDIAENKGGLMLFVKSHIPERRLNDFKIPSNIPIKFRKEK